MKRTLTLAFLVAILLMPCQHLFAQKNILSGTVYDKYDNDVLPYTLISSPCLSEPVMADENGNFEIYVTTDECDFTFLFNTYVTETKHVVFDAKHRKIKLRVALESEVTNIGGITIVEEGQDNERATSTSSIVSIAPAEMANMNITEASDLVDKIPGVAVVDNEPQIRGGSGFSSGMGSRVLIMLDGMPFLRPDAGRPMWSFIPMENIHTIDVHKGASSVVFGSSALTGAVNVITAYPGLTPTTKVTVHAGVYDRPALDYKTSWGKVSPMKWGASFLHSRIIKNNFDFVIGGEYYNDQSYLGPEYPVSVGKSNEGPYEMRARFNFSTRYRAKKIRGLVASLNGNFMYSENATSFFWYDCDTNMYRTYAGSLTTSKDYMFYVDPVISYAIIGIIVAVKYTVLQNIA